MFRFFMRSKLKILGYRVWFYLIIRQNRKHRDLDISDTYRYGWMLDTKMIHKRLHFRFNVCERIFKHKRQSRAT